MDNLDLLYDESMNELKKENSYKLNFGVYYTPAENLCFTAFKAFKKKYKEVENVTFFINDKGERIEKKFFTNSIHVPVYQDTCILNKFKTEAQLASFSNAGCITYGEVEDDVKYNTKALEQIVLAGKKLNLPYVALNFRINECGACGGTDIDEDAKTCRLCGSKNVIFMRRVTGYLGDSETSFNDGKKQEEKLRKKHSFEENEDL